MHKLISLILFACLAGAAQAGPLRKCVDDKGRVYYGDAIPPEVAAKCRESSELTQKGTEKKKTTNLTADEREAKAEEEARTLADKKKLEEQKRRDRALLASYANEGEIDLAMKRNLGQTEATLKSIDARMNTAKAKLADYQKEAATAKAASRAIPASLSSDIKNTENEIVGIEAEKAKALKQADDIKARFEADKKRYRELKGMGAGMPAMR